MEEIDRLAYAYAVKEFPKGNTGKYFDDCVKDFKNGAIQGEKIEKERILKMIQDIFNKTEHTGEKAYMIYLDIKHSLEGL